MENGCINTDGRLLPADHKSDTHSPLWSPATCTNTTVTNTRGRLVQPNTARVCKTKSLEDIFSKHSLFDNSISDEVTTAIVNVDKSNKDEEDGSRTFLDGPKKEPNVMITPKNLKKSKAFKGVSSNVCAENAKVLGATVTYQYQGCCCEVEDTECPCTKKQNIENVPTWNEEDKSEIHFNLTDQYVEKSGMQLSSTMEGHFVHIIDTKSKYPAQMNLRSGDKILGINGQAVSCYQHPIVLVMLRYILFADKASDYVTLVIERHYEQCDKMKNEIFEVRLNIRVTQRGNTAVYINLSTNHLKQYSMFRTAVAWNLCYECRIQNECSSNMLFFSESERKILATPLLHTDGRNNAFKCDIFSGLDHGNSKDFSGRVFIGVFRTGLTDEYIVASTKSKLILMDSKSLDKPIRKTEHADPRFFYVYKTDKGNCFLESMSYRGWYWRVDGVGHLEMIECRNSVDIFTREDMQFTIINMKNDC